MYIVTTWDGISSTIYEIKADTLCEARMVARRRHCLEANVEWCEITKVSHRIGG